MVKNFSKIDLSIIIPTFNEEEGIEPTIDRVYHDAKKQPIKSMLSSFEVIAINDGSFDHTKNVLDKIKKKYKNLRIINHNSNKGLGASILTGVKNSKKKFITYLPADGQAFLNEISGGLQKAPFADLVLTYRGKREDYNSYRNLLSSSLMISMRIFFGLKFKDYNWVHIYKRSLFSKITVNSVICQSKSLFKLK